MTKKEKELYSLLETGSFTTLELSKELSCSTKRVRNLIGGIRRQYEILKSYDENLNEIFLLPKNNKIKLQLKEKKFTYSRSDHYPYMVINLPTPKKSDKIRLVPYGDLQYGLNSTDYSLIDKLFNYIEKSDDTYCWDGGDAMDNGVRTGPGASPYQQKYTPQQQMENLTKKQSKHSHKMFFKQRGNHEDRSVKAVYLDPSKIIADRINVEHFPGQVLMDVVCNETLFEIYSYHGSSNASTFTGRINILNKKAAFAPADIFVMFHVNDFSLGDDARIIKNRRDMTLELKTRNYVLCGSASEYFGSYAEEAAMSPLRQGFKYIDLIVKGKHKGEWDVGKLRF